MTCHTLSKSTVLAVAFSLSLASVGKAWTFEPGPTGGIRRLASASNAVVSLVFAEAPFPALAVNRAQVGGAATGLTQSSPPVSELSGEQLLAQTWEPYLMIPHRPCSPDTEVE